MFIEVPLFSETSPALKNSWLRACKLDCNNYRPISVLSNINKIFEKCVHTRLTNFLQVNKLFFSLQFGFRNGYSTNHALTILTEMIRRAIDQERFACGVFIDLQKTFDTVDHGILLSKRNHYGVRGASYQWCKSYLTGGQQYTTTAYLKLALRSIKGTLMQI